MKQPRYGSRTLNHLNLSAASTHFIMCGLAFTRGCPCDSYDSLHHSIYIHKSSC